MTFSRKEIREITGLSDRTLRWLFEKLKLDPVGQTRTFYGSPVFQYDETTLSKLHAYIFKREADSEAKNGELRCRGGCGDYFLKSELNKSQVCSRCRRFIWIKNEVYNNDPLLNKVDPLVIRELRSILRQLEQA